MNEGVILLVAFAVFAVVIPFGLWRLKRLRAQGIATLQAELGKENIAMLDAKAIFYGFASRGTLQPRGLGGVWALTQDCIVWRGFKYGGPSNIDAEIPLRSVRSLEVRGNFQNMGAVVVGGLLVIGYRTADGAEEQIAFRLSDREAAEARIRERTGPLAGS